MKCTGRKRRPLIASEDKKKGSGYRRLITAEDAASGDKTIIRTRYYVGESSFDAVMAFLVKDLTRATRDMRLDEKDGNLVFCGPSEDGIGLVRGRYAVPEMY